MQHIFVMSVILQLFVMASSCARHSEQNKDSDGLQAPLDSTLKNISPTVAMLNYSIYFRKKFYCQQAEKGNHKSSNEEGESKNDNDRSLLQKMTQNKDKKNQELCALYTLAESETAVTFDEIKKRKQLLPRLLVFSVFFRNYEHTDEVFEEEKIGLFSNDESCRKVEQFAMDQYIPVTKCREWNDISEFFRKK